MLSRFQPHQYKHGRSVCYPRTSLDALCCPGRIHPILWPVSNTLFKTSTIYWIYRIKWIGICFFPPLFAVNHHKTFCVDQSHYCREMLERWFWNVDLITISCDFVKKMIPSPDFSRRTVSGMTQHIRSRPIGSCARLCCGYGVIQLSGKYKQSLQSSGIDP